MISRTAINKAVLSGVMLCAMVLVAAMAVLAQNAEDQDKQQGALTQDVTQGALRIVKKDGEIVECPTLKPHMLHILRAPAVRRESYPLHTNSRQPISARPSVSSAHQNAH